MINEKELIRQCIKKNRKAQRQLYEHYAPLLLGICLRYTGSRPEAEDVLQEGFVKIFRNIKEFEGRSSLMAWMKKIMINTAITMYHRDLKHKHHVDVDEHQERIMTGDPYDGAEFTHEELLGVIARLSAGYRMVFNLYAIEGYKHREIAEQLKIDVNTSKSQYSRARRMIQEMLEKLRMEATPGYEQE